MCTPTEHWSKDKYLISDVPSLCVVLCQCHAFSVSCYVSVMPFPCRILSISCLLRVMYCQCHAFSVSCTVSVLTTPCPVQVIGDIATEPIGLAPRDDVHYISDVDHGDDESTEAEAGRKDKDDESVERTCHL